ncbi:3-hydroxyacyl-CoA dehydrogenase family protein [Aspergillus clavatus NRRL 1]|uniref:3-hydroxyacyl-CoA dehydrogenase, putative n=1 Tax=Aspergillus clavatus (strain ATCC 1007 / CBS 513.65 / DSM 816 / NCTC 3887 / NRRL 1 / QM 1276 / 107) TaxID=344612 RepID=A1CC71_ASPCL|nr:3-hydroxyacyl-CoA dehydrogenase, putative [Aspergillus clavatus NRRL 1]EAW12128.1 3-hydroxyacyl-CoA dehydrogenase, putative [Aspergillus clavatus NRRL 1]
MISTSWIEPDTTTRPVAVIGGGVLGRRLCMMWAAAGHTVQLYEKSPEVAVAALKYIHEALPQQASKLLLGKKAGHGIGHVSPASSLETAVQNAWMVIEAIPELLPLKIELFGQLDQLAPADCILATNSSSYKSREMLEKVARRARVCNAHYYMPPEQNHLEIMTCGFTDPAIISFLLEQAAAAGFVPVHAKVESTGLIFNRIWAAIKREALLVMEEGVASAEEIDDLFKGWFQAQAGPCEMIDRVGLDTVYNIEKHYVEERGLDGKTIEWLKENYLDRGILGRKSGKGLLTEERNGAQLDNGNGHTL